MSYCAGAGAARAARRPGPATKESCAASHSFAFDAHARGMSQEVGPAEHMPCKQCTQQAAEGEFTRDYLYLAPSA